ncbi:5'-nucleotidase domain-containing protein 3 [Branchiostoma belcheri]|nr:5'-nucleotidase domain-containing protein 3 [Branchiostoma belcheri]
MWASWWLTLVLQQNCKRGYYRTTVSLNTCQTQNLVIDGKSDMQMSRISTGGATSASRHTAGSLRRRKTLCKPTCIACSPFLRRSRNKDSNNLSRRVKGHVTQSDADRHSCGVKRELRSLCIRPRIFRIRHPWSGTLGQNSQGRCGNHCKKQEETVKTPLVPGQGSNPQPPRPQSDTLTSPLEGLDPSAGSAISARPYHYPLITGPSTPIIISPGLVAQGWSLLVCTSAQVCLSPAHTAAFFLKNGIEYDPEYLFYDVKNAVISVHLSGDMHKAVAKDMDRYLERGEEISQLLRRLAGAGKKLFLITNSPFWFVQRGMEYISGPNWMEMFDVVIAESRKPKFFTDTKRPFREVSKTLGTCKFERVTSLRKGQVYIQGNLQDFRQMTGWYGARVLYFGDHVYSDLANLQKSDFLFVTAGSLPEHGWRTGAIIPELEDEIKISNSASYKDTISWLLALQGLIESQQMSRHDVAVQNVLQDWLKEMRELRHYTKDIFNPQFGSLFRTHHNPTYFSRRLMRFADIYTSSVANLLHSPSTTRSTRAARRCLTRSTTTPESL